MKVRFTHPPNAPHRLNRGRTVVGIENRLLVERAIARPARARERNRHVDAVCAAPVAVDRVAVVTFLAGLKDAVAAGGELATVGAAVIVDSVPIVALLDARDDSVAAARRLAVGVASVAVDRVAVVADLGR